MNQMDNLDIIYKINYDPDRDFVRIKIKFIDFLKSIFNKQLKSKKFDETYNVNIPKNINKPQKIRKIDNTLEMEIHKRFIQKIQTK